MIASVPKQDPSTQKLKITLFIRTKHIVRNFGIIPPFLATMSSVLGSSAGSCSGNLNKVISRQLNRQRSWSCKGRQPGLLENSCAGDLSEVSLGQLYRQPEYSHADDTSLGQLNKELCW